MRALLLCSLLLHGVMLLMVHLILLRRNGGLVVMCTGMAVRNCEQRSVLLLQLCELLLQD